MSYEGVRLIVLSVAVQTVFTKDLDKNCGAPFGLTKMLVLVIKQLNWTPIKQKINNCAPFELDKV